METLEDAALLVLEQPEGGVRDTRTDGDEQDPRQQIGDVQNRSPS